MESAQLALTGAAEQMKTAADGLRQLDTGEATQSAAKKALAALERLIRDVDSQREQNKQASKSQAGNPKQGDPSKQGDQQQNGRCAK
jgi:hypothetical protein